MSGRKIGIIPDKGEGGTMVHGRIDDGERLGYAGLEVRIENERGEALKTTETDESGYYSFALDQGETGLLSKEWQKGVYISVYDKEGTRMSRKSGTVPSENGSILNFSLKKARTGDTRKRLKRTPGKE
jgi:hypothetical protein